MKLKENPIVIQTMWTEIKNLDTVAKDSRVNSAYEILCLTQGLVQAAKSFTHCAMFRHHSTRARSGIEVVRKANFSPGRSEGPFFRCDLQRNELYFKVVGMVDDVTKLVDVDLEAEKEMRGDDGI
ncbi:hypothetical protein U9M48_041757 [Paspalum notatum var. saurae]|uniref:Uncharacterized protein n=1 Tax=Paspalum notatum var. saurae TaxID=547442 RepID=A0AAQ3UPH5_PASNO